MRPRSRSGPCRCTTAGCGDAITTAFPIHATGAGHFGLEFVAARAVTHSGSSGRAKWTLTRVSSRGSASEQALPTRFGLVCEYGFASVTHDFRARPVTTPCESVPDSARAQVEDGVGVVERLRERAQNSVVARRCRANRYPARIVAPYVRHHPVANGRKLAVMRRSGE